MGVFEHCFGCTRRKHDCVHTAHVCTLGSVILLACLVRLFVHAQRSLRTEAMWLVTTRPYLQRFPGI